MTIQVQKIEIHWNYLVSFETELERISRYVEFDERNFPCFSIELSRVLMAASAEVDVVCKQLCRSLAPNSKAASINSYRDEIQKVYPNIQAFKVLLPRFGLTLVPWHNWQAKNGVPDWWTAHNKVKHHRDSEFHRGNLANALNAVAGLFVMTLHLYKDKAELGELIPAPKLLHVDEEHYGGIGHGGYEFGIAYHL